MARVAAVAVLALGLSAHVGSPNVFYDGRAGPYDIHIVVRPPSVVPGIAQVVIRVAGDDVRRVVIRPVFWRAGVAGAPGGDEATPVAGERRAYEGQLWLMARGAYSVYVTVEGGRGSGTAIVPVVSRATARLSMSPALVVIMTALGAVLVAGLVTIVYAAAGESLAPADAAPTPRRLRSARIAAAVTVPILTLALLGGAAWWNSVDGAYERSLYAPLRDSVMVRADSGRRVLDLAVTDPVWPTLLPVLPDHGKAMHLFLIRDSDMGVLAHLHPVAVDARRFETLLPSGVPAGHYRVYADVVFERGDDRTITGTVAVPAPAGAAPAADTDDAVAEAAGPVSHIGSGDAVRLADGSTMTWLSRPGPFHANQDFTIHVRVQDPSGQPARLDPYMGMAAHAVVLRSDGGVFVHLHPMGSISTAAQQAFALRDLGDTAVNGRLRLPVGGEVMAGSMGVPNDVAIPYAFPSAGRYRIWIQVKRAGRILTGTFDADVS